MQVAFEPYNKITFQSYLKFESAQKFADVIGLVNPPGVPAQGKLYWANGVIFRFYNHTPSEAVSREWLNGHVVFDHIEFASMPTYTNELKIAIRPLITIFVLDVTKHVVFDPLTAYIKENLLK